MGSGRELRYTTNNHKKKDKQTNMQTNKQANKKQGMLSLKSRRFDVS